MATKTSELGVSSLSAEEKTTMESMADGAPLAAEPAQNRSLNEKGRDAESLARKDRLAQALRANLRRRKTARRGALRAGEEADQP